MHELDPVELQVLHTQHCNQLLTNLKFQQTYTICGRTDLAAECGRLAKYHRARAEYWQQAINNLTKPH